MVIKWSDLALERLREIETIRSLVASDIYKVVYYVDEKTVRIITVYDCRQNPETLRKEVKKAFP